MTAVDDRRYRILLVDDDPGLLRLLTIRLKSEGYEVAACESAMQAQASVPRFRPDVVVTDLRMAEQDGIGLLKDLQRRYPALPVILMTAHGTIPDAVQATQSGAFAFLTKPIDREELLDQLRKALKVSGFAATGDGWRHGIITRNALMEERLAEAQMAAAAEDCVMITGQPGTGRKLLAQAIHRAGPRAKHPCVIVRCAALSADGLQQVLAECPEAGTAVLEQVGELPVESQEALAQFIHPGTGPRPRIISTAVPELRGMVAKGEFREDLYYRLATIRIDLPSLGQRRDDIPLLATRAIEELGQEADQRRVLAPEAVEVLISAEYPGNIQQLFAVIRHAAALSTGPVVSGQAIQRALGSGAARVPSFDEARDEFTRNYLEQLLRITRGNVTQAARLAGRNRTDFYKLLSRHDISPERYKPG